MKEMLREFVNFIRRRHTHYRTEGGCETCGWGGREFEEIDVDELVGNLDADIDQFIEEMKDRNEK